MKRSIFAVLFSAMICVLCCQAADGGFDELYRCYRGKSMPELKQLGQELLSRNSTDSALAPGGYIRIRVGGEIPFS